MAESAELTTRDVLSQIDRRLTRVEDDLREFRQYVEQRFADLEAKVDRNLRWTIGLNLVMWLSVMAKLTLG